MKFDPKSNAYTFDFSKGSGQWAFFRLITEGFEVFPRISITFLGGFVISTLRAFNSEGDLVASFDHYHDEKCPVLSYTDEDIKLVRGRFITENPGVERYLKKLPPEEQKEERRGLYLL